MDDRQYYSKIHNLLKNQSKMLTAFGLISDVIGSTMGPGGRTVSINEPGRAYSTKDGANVLKMMSFEDEITDFVAKILQDITGRTVNKVGDGTTLTTILTYKLYECAIKHSKTRNIYEVLDAMRKEVDMLSEVIKTFSHNISLNTVRGLDMLRSVSTISANNNDEYGRLVSDIVAKVGSSGYVSVQTSKDGVNRVEKKKGYVIGSGMLHAKLMRGQKRVEVREPYVVVADQVLDDYDRDLLKILNEWVEHNQRSGKVRPLVIIVQDMEGLALSGLVNNTNLPVYAVRLPGYMNRREDRYSMVEDIMVVTGTKVLLSKTEGYDIENFDSLVIDRGGFDNVAGRVTKISITQDECSIEYDGNVEIENNVKSYIDSIDMMLRDDPNNQYLKSRKTLLESGVGTIYIHTESDNERKYVEDLLDDSIKASFSALKNGIVAGGGQTLIRIHNDYRDKFPYIEDTFLYPFYIITANSGLSSGEVVKISKKLANDHFDIVYDAKERGFNSIVANSVWDPVEVITNAYQNAMSAVMISTSKYIINFDLNKDFYGNRGV